MSMCVQRKRCECDHSFASMHTIKCKKCHVARKICASLSVTKLEVSKTRMHKRVRQGLILEWVSVEVSYCVNRPLLYLLPTATSKFLRFE